MIIPISTYRLQFMPAFGFKEAQSIVAYLDALGISDIYASPIFKAKAGSTHGYDIIDPNEVNPEIAGMEGFEELAKAAQQRGMGWLQDIVPNHTAFDGENQMLMDIFESGKSSIFFDFFDIEWNEGVRGKILAPFLGSFYAECLENGEIQLKYDQAGLSINYYALRFPLKIESYGTVFDHHLARLKRQVGRDHPDFMKLLGVLYVLRNLASHEEIQERTEQISFVKGMLWEIYTSNQQIRQFMDESVARFNGEKGKPESFNLLDNLLDEQFFRLSFWKVATEEVDYRRFFNINGLISVKVENEKVFHYTHALIHRLVQEKRFTGLRIDHIDGLYDPTTYLKRLKEKMGEIYVTVEKILDLGEELPAFWPVQGTTGYDFLNYVNGLFCRRRNEAKFDKIYTRFTEFQTPYERLVSEKKRLIMGRHMAGEVDRLAQQMKFLSIHDRYGRDITLYGLRRALVEMLAWFPVYRSYISHESITETDRAVIREAIAKAKRTNPGLLHELEFIQRCFLLEFHSTLADDQKNRWMHFIMKFQQLTGPLMAKGFEDTSLYIYNRLLSLNEVGGRPNIFGISLELFHEFNAKRAQQWPHAMNATSTHDTKRGEDVRARINVLSEMPEEWERNIKAWSKANRRKKNPVNDEVFPDDNDEYFLYQTLIGAYPFDQSEHAAFVQRIKSYIIKAVREAKVHTAWLKPDAAYEEAFHSFIDDILAFSEQNKFLKEFLQFQKKVAFYGIFNSLSQTLVKITSPGVPDFYQGTELWDLNLVDPDNRRPVDYEKRKDFLREIKERVAHDILALINDLLAAKEDGRIKLFLIYQALAARRANLEVFQHGTYLPLKVEGKFENHIIAFARKTENAWALMIAPRFLSGVVKEGEYPLGEQAWADTRVVMPAEAPVMWNNALTSQPISGERGLWLADVFQHFPAALLLGGKKR
ncbi:malto-oligosyltrehalose synthase [candidate division KSB1 bacterium]|nr:malto-oligosyltrehalose synthase [candidate division KSB1 bacterium]